MSRMRIQVVLLGILCLCASYSARSQERQTEEQRTNLDARPAMTRPPQSELEKQNASRVSAAPEQIREVLVKDPGLLVELKRWIAKKATDDGQLIEDADLTDQVIFDRLNDDILFRSAATRLVQRYGYLLPSVNPDSPMGKQQELLLKERARRMVQIESQEDTESLRKDRSENTDSDMERTSACDPRQDEDCQELNSRTSRRGSNTRSRESQDERQDQEKSPRQNPSMNGGPILRTDLGGDHLDSLPISSGSMSDVMKLAAMDPSLMGSMGRTNPSLSGNIGSSLGGGILPRPDSDFSRPSESDSTNSSNAHSEKDYKNYKDYYRSRNRRDSDSNSSSKDLSAGNILHKSNPYSDIPSLYDLYVQVSAHDRTPKRFGVDFLRDGVREPNAIAMDLPVGPDYVVGPGDGLSIDLWGGVSQRLVRVVDREGRISLPEAGPLLVSGRTLGDVQATVQQSLRGQFRDVSADVSLSRLRTVRVYVVGEVSEPGAYDISSLSTPLNALVAAGGITQRGSLRSLKHYRGKQLIEVVDAYDLLLRGVGTDQKRLENGDSLLVPPTGRQVTVEGMVRRPAVYELHEENNLEEVLELAGGLLPAAALQHVEVERLVAHQNRTMFSLDLSEKENSTETVSKLSSFKIEDGDRIHIFPIAPYNDQAIYLQGHVLRPGRYSFKDGMRLTDLVTSYTDLLPEPAGKYAEIIRLNAPDYRPTVESFDLTAALANPTASPKLQPLDTVRIFSRFDFEPSPQIWIGGEVRSPGQYKTSGQSRLRDAIFLAGGVSQDASLDSAQLFRTEKDGTLKILSVNLNSALSGSSADNILLQPRDRILVQRNSAQVDPPTVYIKGDVDKPGRYPLTSNMHIDDLIRVSGGLKRSADSQNAVLTHLDETGMPSTSPSSTSISLTEAMAGNSDVNKLLSNGDVLSIRQNPGWNDLGATVTIRGEVQHPGTYGIRPGESLSAVLEKAGGFTPQAYPFATVLTRRDVRELEMKTRLELVGRVKAEQSLLKALPENDQDQKDAKLSAIAQTDTTLTQLQSNLPVGRVVVHSSPDLKSYQRAAAGTPLRNGDVILIPKKANYVVVNGQVFNPTATGFVPGRSAKWYLSQAGGTTQLADKKGVFVIRANGSVIGAKNTGGLWSGDPLNAVLMPGDSIVVPEKAPKIGVRNWTSLIQSAQVATSVALAVAYLKP